MNDEHHHRVSELVRVDLIDADADIAFGLVDNALEKFHNGNLPFKKHALGAAETMLDDIDTRLHQLSPAHSAPFGPLVDELRKAIRAAASEYV